MPYIKVDLNVLYSAELTFTKSKSSVDSIRDDFSGIAGKLDWDIKTTDIKKRISNVKDALKDESKRLKKLYEFMEKAREKYDDLRYDPERDAREREERAAKAKVFNWITIGLCVVATIAVTVATGGAALPMIAVGAATGAVSAGALSASEQYVEHGMDGIDWSEVGEDAAVGAVTGAISSAVGAGSSAVASKVSNAVLKPAMTGMQRIGTQAVISGTSDIVSGIVTRGTTEYIKTGDAEAAWSKAIDGKEIVLDGAMGAIGGGVEEYSSLKKAQGAANDTAKSINKNQKTTPLQDGEAAGLKNLKETPNGGVSFRESDYIMKVDGKPVSVKIKPTGDRVKDYQMAEQVLREQGVDVDFQSMRTGTDKTHVWHHLDDYNVMDNEITMEFVDVSAHDAIKKHAGSAKQYQVVHGEGYSKKVIDVNYKGIDIGDYSGPIREGINSGVEANDTINSKNE